MMMENTFEAKKELYRSIFSAEWQGKPVWQHIDEKNLTSVPALGGTKYSEEKTKIMIVGRAVNGWQVPFDDCSSLENTINSVLYQENRLHEFANEFVPDEKTGKKYYYAQSPFIQMMKSIVTTVSGTDEDWTQRLVWSNLFKVAPRDGNNPSWMLVRNHIAEYREILRMEIAEAQPNLVVFVTGYNYIEPYPGNDRYESFLSLFEDGQVRNTNLPENIEATGVFANNPQTKMIICKRPEFLKGGVQQLVNNVLEAYRITK